MSRLSTRHSQSIPNISATLIAEFADATDANKASIRWMEKFGEWKHMTQVSDWKPGAQVTWTVDVAEPGDYQVELTYKGDGGQSKEFDWRTGVNYSDAGRLVWRVETDEGAKLQNQQNSANVYHTYPFGMLTFAKAGKHTIKVSLIAGDRIKASLASLRFTPVK